MSYADGVRESGCRVVLSGSAATSSWWNSRSALLVGDLILQCRCLLPPRRATRSMEPDQAATLDASFFGIPLSTHCRRLFLNISLRRESLKPGTGRILPGARGSSIGKRPPARHSDSGCQPGDPPSMAFKRWRTIWRKWPCRLPCLKKPHIHIWIRA